ncbi:MAG: hypothetical protein H7329_16635 [Opitutaceae bacterium]|nr:hypothetical protein [Cytophagales bacterium]
MKTICKVLGLVFIISTSVSCKTANYNSQPWMPHKAKGKSQNHGQSKRASVTHREYNNF